MKRLGSMALSLALLVGLTGVLSAQDGNVSAEDGNTSVEIDGSVMTKVFRRDNNINTILDDSNETRGSGMLYHYTLGVNAHVGERVTGRIEIENPLLTTDGEDAIEDATIGDQENSGDNAQISEAYIQADRFLAEPLSLKIGIQDYETDLRGDGNPFFLDLRDSESINDERNTIQENVGSGDYDGTAQNYDAGGVKLTTDVGKAGALDLFWFTVEENDIEDTDDEHILGGVFNGNLADTGSYQVVGTAFRDTAVGGAHQTVWTVGGGVEYDVTSAANVYGEAYVQGGERDSNSDQGTSLAVDLGVAGEAGMFFYDVSGTHVSGDDGDDTSSDEDNEDFVSYEDNDDTMILESNVLGLDVDSNYQKLQVSGGIDGTVVKKDDLSVELLAAWAQNETTVKGPGGSDLDDSLGIETDLTVTWTHSESLDFQVGLARVWGGDFWADDNGYDTNSDGLDLYTFTAGLNF